MSFLKTHIDVILPLVAILAVLALLTRKPSRSAIILLCQAIIIDIYLGIVYGLTSTIFGVSILLTFFCLIAFGANFYLEISFKKLESKPPKLNILVGIILMLMFWRYLKDFFLAGSPLERIYFLNLNYDGLSLVVAAFSVFAILAASLIILDVKNPKPGDQL